MADIFETEVFRQLLINMQQLQTPDASDCWPTDALKAMAATGVNRWDIPKEFGGLDLSPPMMLTGLRLLASSCLTSTFVYTQRSAAVRRIATSENSAAKADLLPRLRDSEISATVGISHLTTSGRHLKSPLVSVEKTADGFAFDGTVPWTTGATQADYLVTGGTLADGTEILAAVPMAAKGLTVNRPADLLAMNASQTGSVTLKNVRVPVSQVLHGPVESVMSHGTGGGAGSLGTSALAVGATEATLRGITVEAARRPDLAEFLDSLRTEHDALVKDLNLVADHNPATNATAETVRRQANSLASRAAQAWLAATKGAGFVAGHPAERAVRESMFFLVWSCPQPVLSANLKELACRP